MQETIQGNEFIREAQRLADFYGGVAAVLNNPNGDEDFQFLADVFATLNGEAGHNIETAAVAHIADLFESCNEDPEERYQRAHALRLLLRRAGKLTAQQIDELAAEGAVTR